MDQPPELIAKKGTKKVKKVVGDDLKFEGSMNEGSKSSGVDRNTKKRNKGDKKLTDDGEKKLGQTEKSKNKLINKRKSKMQSKKRKHQNGVPTAPPGEEEQEDEDDESLGVYNVDGTINQTKMEKFYIRHKYPISSKDKILEQLCAAAKERKIFENKKTPKKLDEFFEDSIYNKELITTHKIILGNRPMSVQFYSVSFA